MFINHDGRNHVILEEEEEEEKNSYLMAMVEAKIINKFYFN